LKAACEEASIPQPTVISWVKSDDKFSSEYARARESGYLLMAEELVQIADTPELGVEVKTNELGEREVKEGDMLGHRKLRVDTRKWLLSKMLPKVYGDSTKVEIGGSLDVKKLSDEDLDAELAALGAAIPKAGSDPG
jgi:hypothetical protein